MPVKHAIWKVGDHPQPFVPCSLATEQLLEDMIVRQPRILTSDYGDKKDRHNPTSRVRRVGVQER